MKKLLASLLLLVSSISFGQGGSATQIRTGTSLPATCTVGGIYMLTSGQQGLYSCITTNTWSYQGAIPAGATTGQLPIWNNSSQLWIPGDPIVSFAFVNLLSAQPATGTAIGTATRLPTFSASGTLYVTFASITGAGTSCTVQLKNYDSLGNSINNGSPINVTPSNGTTSSAVSASPSLATAAQISATYACSGYPSGGTISVDYVPTVTTSTNVNQVGGSSVSTSATGVQKVGVVGNTGATVDTSAAQNQAPPTNMIVTGAEFNTSPTTITSGNASPLQMDNAGNLLVNVKVGGGTGGTSSTFNAAFPGVGTAIGAKNGANMVNLVTDGSNNLDINCQAGCSVAGDQNTGTTALGALNAVITVPLSGERGITFQLQSGGTGLYTVTPQCSYDGGAVYNTNAYIQDPFTGAVSNTAAISSGQGTTDYPVMCPGGASHAQMKVTSYSSGSANWLARSTVNTWPGLTWGLVTANAPTYTTGQVNVTSIDTSGLTRVSVKDTPSNTNNFNVNIAASSATVSVAGTQSDNSANSSSKAPVIPCRANASAPSWTEGNEAPCSVDLNGNERVAVANTVATNITQVSGSSVATAGTGIQKVGVVGNAGGAFDAAGQNVASPANEVLVGAQFNTSPTTITSGNTSPLQVDNAGNLKVNVNANSFGTLAVNNTQQGTASQNVAQFGGSAVVTGTGAGGAGIPRVTISNDSSLAANQSVNVNQIGGSAVSTAATGTQKVGITGNAGAAMDAAGQNATSPANEILVGAQFNTSPTTITSGNMSPLQVDNAGNLLVNVKSGGGTGGTSSNFNAAFPSTGTAIGVKNGANMVNLAADASSNLLVNCATGCAAANDQSTGSTALGALNATITVPLTSTRGATFQLQSGGTGAYTVTPQCSFDGGTIYNANGYIQDPFTGIVSTTAVVVSAQATTDYPVMCPQGSSNAQMKVTAYTSGTANWLARATVVTWPGLGWGLVSTNAPSYTTGQINVISLDTNGLERVSLKDTPSNTNNFNINTAQYGGSNVVTGTGASGAGIPRVTISNDSSLVGTLANNGAAAATNRFGILPGIFQTSYQNGTAGTQGRDAAVNIGTDGLTWTANLPAIRPCSYRASSKFAASSTTDNAVLPGNATNTVLVTEVRVSGIQTTAGMVNVEIAKRSAADTGGTSATMTVVPEDSNCAAGVSAPLSYTGTGPAIGAAVGDLDNTEVGFMASGTAAPNDIYILNLRQKPIVLRGTAQQLAINLGGAVTGGTMTVTFVWIETTTITP